MLKELHIQGFTIVKQLAVDFLSGMTVITGETGAGKSIILDALSLVLGERGDAKLVRDGEKRCDISAYFDITQHPELQQWLLDHELDGANECVLRRTINQEGRSQAYINMRPCPVQWLREIGERLVDLYGQHEHHSLLKTDQQRWLLDRYAGHLELLETVKAAYFSWQETSTKITDLTSNTASGDARRQLLEYQVQELKELNCEPEHIEQLEKDYRRLHQSEHWLSACQQALSYLSEDESRTVLALLHQASIALASAPTGERHLDNAKLALENALIQIEEASGELRYYLDTLDVEPAQLADIERQLSMLHNIARKHRVKITEVPTLLAQLSAELESLTHREAALVLLEKQRDSLQQIYLESAQHLTKSRQEAAQILSDLITEKMQDLGLKGGRLNIVLDPLADNKYSAEGLEQVEFQVSTNPGQALRALHKTVSGGELSRIALAIQVIAIQQQASACLIFDEADVGIGGGTAEIVGQLLKVLSQHAQVFCITHLPQIASQGDYHYRVAKHHTHNETTVTVMQLTVDERVEELARMLGGQQITSQTRAHAKEMLEIHG